MTELKVSVRNVRACAESFSSIATIAGEACSTVSETAASAGSAIMDERASSIIQQLNSACQALEEIQAYAQMYKSKLDNFASIAASKK